MVLVISLIFSFTTILSVASDQTDDVFSKQPVWRIQIEITPENVARLRAEARKYVPATVRVFGEVLSNAGVQLKGHGTFQPIDERPSFTIDFGKFAAEQSFRGLRKIHLNNSDQDPTYIKEQLGSELFRAVQVPAPRVAHALVELNGRQLGLYVLKEGFTTEFLGRHFDRADGNLYDNDEGHDVDQPMKRHLGPASAKGQAELQRLASAALESDLSRRWHRLQEHLDMERFLTFMAAEIMICHWDGYCLSKNNFRIYHEPGQDKIFFLPSGMDQLFSKADLTWKPDMSGMVARAILAVPEGRRQYEARFKELFAAVFNSARITNRVHELVSELRPALKPREFEAVRREAAELCARIVDRENSLRRQLSQPELLFPNFANDLALLTDWQAFDKPAGASMQSTAAPEGGIALKIGTRAKASASWRTTVRLRRGRYEFAANARVRDVTPLSFGKNQGASLRVSGKGVRSVELVGTNAGNVLKTEFEVNADEEVVVLVCELRAEAGEACFEKPFLSVRRPR
jgi:hypothetical protein